MISVFFCGQADVSVVKEKSSALSNASMKIGQAIYGKKGEEGGDASGGAAEGA